MAALRSQSCFSPLSGSTMNSGMRPQGHVVAGREARGREHAPVRLDLAVEALTRTPGRATEPPSDDSQCSMG